MYDVFVQLLQKYGVTTYKVAKETGISQTTFSNWKSGRSMLKTDALQKIADYFGVTIDYLMTGKEETELKETSLTTKDERDISRKLSMTLDLLEAQDGLMFDGEALDDETKELLRISIESTLRTAKITAKKKFTPKKYRRDE